MKKHTPPSSQLADEQLLFTPEEMFGDVTVPDEQTTEDATSVTYESTMMTDDETVVTDDIDTQPEEQHHITTTPESRHPTSDPQQPKPDTNRPSWQPAAAKEEQTDNADDTFINEDRIVTEMTIALEFSDSLTLGQIRLIALEASVIWQNGVHPTGTYSIQSMPDYTFDGYKFLALYYVMFYRAFPSMIEKLNLPYDRLYLIARRRYDGYKPKH